jgi:hypothetical protein
MGQPNAEADTTNLLRDLLKRTEQAHGVHEKELGKRDEDWPQWYAEYMARTLREAGYSINRRD